MNIRCNANWITRETYVLIDDMSIIVTDDEIFAPIGAVLSDETIETLYQIQSVYSAVIELLIMFYTKGGWVEEPRRLPKLDTKSVAYALEHCWVIWQYYVDIHEAYRTMLYGILNAVLNAFPRRGYVYLIKSASGYWKIGKAKNPKNRLKTFEVKLPFEVKLDHTIMCADMHQTEKILHKYFAAKRCNGSEFFDLTDEDVALIKSFWFVNNDGIAITNTREYQGIPGISYRWVHEMLS